MLIKIQSGKKLVYLKKYLSFYNVYAGSKAREKRHLNCP